MIMTVQTRLNLTGLDNLQRNFATFTSAYLERLGRVIIEENINKVAPPEVARKVLGVIQDNLG